MPIWTYPVPGFSRQRNLRLTKTAVGFCRIRPGQKSCSVALSSSSSTPLTWLQRGSNPVQSFFGWIMKNDCLTVFFFILTLYNKILLCSFHPYLISLFYEKPGLPSSIALVAVSSRKKMYWSLGCILQLEIACNLCKWLQALWELVH